MPYIHNVDNSSKFYNSKIVFSIFASFEGFKSEMTKGIFKQSIYTFLAEEKGLL